MPSWPWHRRWKILCQKFLTSKLVRSGSLVVRYFCLLQWLNLHLWIQFTEESKNTIININFNIFKLEIKILFVCRKNVPLKKVNSKYILKSTLTPRLARKQFQKNTVGLERSRSWSSLDNGNMEKDYSSQNYLTVHVSEKKLFSMSKLCCVEKRVMKRRRKKDRFYLGNLFYQSFPSTLNTPSVRIEDERDYSTGSIVTIDQSPSPPSPKSHPRRHTLAKLHNFTTMSPQEIAQWIDRRSRIVFPVAFLIFNILYWSFINLWLILLCKVI